MPLPSHLHGRAFLGRSLTAPRAFVHGTHDRQDERYERVRMVRDHRFKYLRNYMPEKPYYQHMNSSEGSVIMQEIRRGHAEGTLPPAAERFLAPEKPREELYDLATDPHELRNLAGSEAYRPALERMRAEHVRWEEQTGDLGWIPEPELYLREKSLGTRYEILRRGEGQALQKRLRETFTAGERHDTAALLKFSKDADAAVRYLAILNLRETAVIGKALNDPSPCVRIAAAYAGLRCGLSEASAAALAKELQSDDEWVRLLAANAMDEAGEFARPHAGVLQTALTDRRNTTTYVPRVVNHTLNRLFDTKNTVR